jgi:hypothetical protein
MTLRKLKKSQPIRTGLINTPNYPLSIEASEEQKLDLILDDDLFKDKFSKLKSLLSLVVN